MGFYLRKSVSVGPFRFNLSKSGIGVSAGVKGFRIGSGPRGNYIHIGGNGLYYRRTIPTVCPKDQTQETHHNSTPPSDHEYDRVDGMNPIESADVSSMVDSSSAELLNELNQKRMKIRAWPIVTAVLGMLIAVAIFSVWPAWLIFFLAAIGAACIYFAYQYDVQSKTAVLFYSLDTEIEKGLSKFHDHAKKIGSCSGVWHIESSGKVRDRKYHAGASELVSRKKTTIHKAQPPYLETNVECVAIGVGRQTLYFFPDRVLIYDTNGVGAVGYQDLRIEVQQGRFIETEGVPSDSTVIDKTWKYVNKSGGPDRRFKDNRELPICLYEYLHFTSGTGVNELIQLSKCGYGDDFFAAVNSLGRALPQERN